MPTASSSVFPDAVSTQVWVALDPERQLQAIQLLARMAANLAATQPEPSQTEVSHARATDSLEIAS
jgi:hypothetical protein